jgi:hypothetical protein
VRHNAHTYADTHTDSDANTYPYTHTNSDAYSHTDQQLPAMGLG